MSFIVLAQRRSGFRVFDCRAEVSRSLRGARGDGYLFCTPRPQVSGVTRKNDLPGRVDTPDGSCAYCARTEGRLWESR